MDNAPAWPVVAGEMAQCIRQHDWASSPLGPVEQWPVSLRTIVQTVVAHPFPTIVLWGPQLIQIYNDGYRALMGAKHPAGLGQPTRECWSEVWHINAPLYERVWRGESVYLEDALFPITRSGVLEDAWFTLSYSPVRDESGEVAGVFLTIFETTRRLRAEAALRESEDRLSLAVEVGELASWDWDMSTGRIVWSREHFRMQGYAVGEVEPSYEAWLARVHPQDRAAAEAALLQARDQHRDYDHEFRTLLPDGSVHWISAHGRFFYDDQRRPRRMIGVMRDITEQRNVRELLEHRIEQRTHVLRQLLVRVESVQDEERRRIARELHDGLGQYLTAVTLAVGALKDAPTDLPTRERVQRLNELMQHLDRELDRMVFLLRPTALEDCGLGEGVAAYVRSWSELTGVSVDLELHGLDGERLPTSVETAVFRIVQEALNNVAKHARASRVSVSLEQRRRQLMGSIEDDGVGFETADAPAAPKASRTHWGLVGMRERIEALGGTFAIESRAGEGTSILLRVPLH
jgi:PAS domain S-box-containing protein